MAGLTLQLALAMILVCHTLTDCTRAMRRDLVSLQTDALFVEHLDLVHVSSLFSHMSILSVNLWRTLWLIRSAVRRVPFLTPRSKPQRQDPNLLPSSTANPGFPKTPNQQKVLFGRKGHSHFAK